MELREKIARALCLEAFGGRHVDNWFTGFLCQADAVLKVIRPIIEERDALRAEIEAAETAWKESDKTCFDLTEKVIPNIRASIEVAEKERDKLKKLDASRCAKISSYLIANARLAEERDTLQGELEALKTALREIAWSNDSKWQADRARDVLGEQK